jgi:hypothetical protein
MIDLDELFDPDLEIEEELKESFGASAPTLKPLEDTQRLEEENKELAIEQDEGEILAIEEADDEKEAKLRS